MQLVRDLLAFSKDGARAVVLFLQPADVNKLAQALQLVHDNNQLDHQQLVLISSTAWGDNTHLVKLKDQSNSVKFKKINHLLLFRDKSKEISDRDLIK